MRKNTQNEQPKNLVKWLLLKFLLIICLSATYAQKKSSIYISSARNFSNFSPDIPEAGEDINSVFTTSSSVIRLNVTAFRGYRITVRQEDINWDSNLCFFVRRTGNGNGTGNWISGGTNYIKLTPFNQTFFEGYYSRTGVPIQYQVTNLSVLLPSGDQTTNIVYTITDL